MRHRLRRPPSRRLLSAAVALGAVAALGACATPFRSEVTRFQALPPAQGQSFAVIPDDAALLGSLEFGRYADLVTQNMVAQGYRPVADPTGADLLVRLAYGVGEGREKIVDDGFRGPGGFAGGFGYGNFSPFGFGYYGHPLGFGGFYGRPYRLGFYDPFLFGGYGFRGYGGVRSFTVYDSDLALTIDRRADGQRLFEGRAEARSRSDNLTYLVPNLVEAMFTGFPGNSGETVRISVAPEDERRRR